MHFLFILLVYFEMVLSNPSPNIWARGFEALSNLNPLASRDTSLTVYPTDPQNTGQLLETHKFLKGLYGEEHVKFNPQEGSLSWTISLQNDDTTDALQGHTGLRLDKETEKSKRSEVVKRDDSYYIAIAANPDDDEQTKATREFLNSKVKNSNQEIIELHKPGTDHVMAWGNLQLTSDAKAAVEGYEGIKAPLGDDSEVTDERAVTTDEHLDVRTASRSDELGSSQRASKSVEERAIPAKRAVTYTKQAGAPAHLVMISQPKEMKDEKLNDFVYDENAGIGTYVYVIDSGAAYNVKNKDGNKEFERVEPLQTQHSKDDGEKEDEDGSDISHGTLVSSQAVGRKYGVAKAATLVSVKLRSKIRRIIDFLQGLEAVTKHLEGKPERHAKSVVISSLGFKSQMTHEKAKSDPDAGLMRTYFDSLFGMGVPFISSSGNLGDLFKTIDRLPKVLEDQETPIINVGAVDMDGNKPKMSQDGPQLTISAPGIGVTGQTKEEQKEGEEPGTSHAAPLVAGVIATYLNYDPPPWDGSKIGKARVQAIKDYIASDKSSWVRKAGSDVNVIWNGATKDDHKSVGANQCASSKRGDCDNSPPPQPSSSAPAPAPSSPPHPTKAISIILQNYIDEVSNTNSWLFFTTSIGVSVLCHSEKDAVSQVPTTDDPAMVDNPPWPGGTYPLKLDGTDCEDKNDGRNPGAFWCNGRDGAIACQEDDLRWSKEDKECDKGLWSITQLLVTFCEW